MQHAVAGWTPYMSFPFQWDGDFVQFARAAPMLGEHNDEVLSGILGLGDDEIDALARGACDRHPPGVALTTRYPPAGSAAVCLAWRLWWQGAQRILSSSMMVCRVCS